MDQAMTKTTIRIAFFVLLFATSAAFHGQEIQLGMKNQQIFAPSCMNLHNVWEGPPVVCPPYIHDRWIKEMQRWRDERRIYLAYDGKRYDMPELKWSQSSFIQPQVMVHDRYLYDPATAHYTVDKFLEDLDRRYGGVDSVLIWSTYPNMGVDDRNQLQMLESMPGGLTGVKQMVEDFHKHGVKVFFPMMMWDQGTSKPDKSWPDAVAEVMKQINADGINGDTQNGVPLGFVEAAENAGHPLVFEPEVSEDDTNVAWNLSTWGQYEFTTIPAVDKLKWIEPRHMVNISDRWALDKTNDLQFAFFNGVGWESWENIWGIWNGINSRDAEATRRVSSIEREFAKFLVSPDWDPLSPMRNYGVYASRWPLGEETLWTIVNRNAFDLDGSQMDVPAVPGTRYYDLYHGIELKPQKDGDRDVLYFQIEANGYMGIFATTSELTAKQQEFLTKMRTMTRRPLNAYGHEWKFIPQKMNETGPSVAAKDAPDGMVAIPGAEFFFKVHGEEIEGDNMPGVDVQYTWEESPHRFHERKLAVKPFFIDKYPVTNAEFKKFLDASGYTPKDKGNFLKDWKGGNIPAGWENRPVTWVSIEDARAYARWAGKRLPHEWEWQLAAQGTDGRHYPWGNQLYSPSQDLSIDPLKSGFYFPVQDTGRTMRGPDPVDAHPNGASPYGVMDMVGNVWQLTDEYYDDHTRAAILRGGEYYAPQGSVWYFPDSLRNDTHGKLLLMAPSLDRSGGIGFRCVKDVATAPATVKAATK
jgi:formylglycine-generating enzyme required for sulfatase activity